VERIDDRAARAAAVATGLRRLRAAKDDGSLTDLCTRMGVELLTLHGSAARGEDGAQDLDLGALFASDLAGRNLLDLVVAIIDLTGTDLIDVMDVRRATPTARARALAHDARVLHEARPGLATRQQMAAVTLELELGRLRRRQLELLAAT
jgi:predicted nucleotidyltransferase